MSMYSKDQLVECGDLTNTSEIKCYVDDSKIELGGKIPDSTAQAGREKAGIR